MNIEVQLLDNRLRDWGFPIYGSELSAGLDLFACIESPVLLLPQAPPKLISSGIALHIADPDWCALIMPRSGGGHDKGLVLGNTVGVVDPDYSGPCLISAWNRNAIGSSADIRINPGDRIAQLLIMRTTRPQWRIVKEFSQSSGRGSAGFGSTGS